MCKPIDLICRCRVCRRRRGALYTARFRERRPASRDTSPETHVPAAHVITCHTKTSTHATNTTLLPFHIHSDDIQNMRCASSIINPVADHIGFWTVDRQNASKSRGGLSDNEPAPMGQDPGKIFKGLWTYQTGSWTSLANKSEIN